jgi:hypothetical protein
MPLLTRFLGACKAMRRFVMMACHCRTASGPVVPWRLHLVAIYIWRCLWVALFDVVSRLDAVYDAKKSTTEIYEESASPLIEATLMGMNATIFAYGQTSSGKTFTMQGTPDQPGIIPLALRHIFDMIQRVKWCE